MQYTPLHWTSDYETGIEEIDLQHHYFMTLINRIEDEIQQSTDLAYHKRLLDELCKYASFHFISEENIMHKLGYPERQQHYLLHRNLLDKLSWALVQHSEEKFIGFLHDWFLHHTVTEDKKVGVFARTVN
ncbi:MAG: hemerythrin domain-containing protein [Rhodocyclaceae bacterium]|nr:hemerythrin domain-containing protein [Rhodocyclaceae bacterium]